MGGKTLLSMASVCKWSGGGLQGGSNPLAQCHSSGGMANVADSHWKVADMAGLVSCSPASRISRNNVDSGDLLNLWNSLGVFLVCDGNSHKPKAVVQGNHYALWFHITMQFNVFAWNEFPPVPGAQFLHPCSLRPHFRGAHSSYWVPHSQPLLWRYMTWHFSLVAFYTWWWTFWYLNLRNICYNKSFWHGLWVSLSIPFWGRRGSTVSMWVLRLCKSRCKCTSWVFVCASLGQSRRKRGMSLSDPSFVGSGQLLNPLWKPFPWHVSDNTLSSRTHI